MKATTHHIGLIGCGGIAGTWLKAVGETPGCRLEAVFDLDGQAARRRAGEAGARAMADLDQLLAAEVDLVIVATPTPSHPELVERAAAAGKHVLCEKPMALSVSACRRMIEACARSGVKLAVGHSLRFWGAFRTVRRLVAEGAIGAPVAGSIDRMGIAKVVRAGGQGGGTDTWRAAVRNTGGHVLEGFVHELDFARAVFGRAAAVTCEIAGGRQYDGWVSPQVVQGLVTFESGALVTARTGSTVALPTRGYWVAGTQGGVRFTEWGGPVQLYRRDRPEPEAVPGEEGFAYTLELADLLAAVHGQVAEPENSGANGLETTALGLAFYRACETGRRVEFRAGVPVMPEDYQNTRWP